MQHDRIRTNGFQGVSISEGRRQAQNAQPVIDLLPGKLTIAVDTEFADAVTLTVQTAARLDTDTLAVQVYRSTAVPRLPEDFDQDYYLPTTPRMYGRFARKIIVRPVKRLTPELSPMMMARELLGLKKAEILTLPEGLDDIERLASLPEASRRAPVNLTWDPRRKRWKVPAFHLTLLGHYLRADFPRLFGRDFLESLGNNATRIAVHERKVPRFLCGRDGSPVLEYVAYAGDLYAVRVATRDTMQPFGSATLDRHSQTFLGLGKCDVLTEPDKKDMLRTFKNRADDAYGYAMTDVVNTLLIHEQMTTKDRDIYRAFGFPDEDVPPLRGFQGGRVSTFLMATTRRDVAAGSEELPSGARLRELMRQGGVGLFEDEPGVSKFGTQVANVHGGLLFTRSPTQVWHEAQGMLADVDLSGCYNEITGRIDVYCGRPVIWEPGSRCTTLAQAVAVARDLADDGGWMVWVTGPVAGYANVLVSSTDDAVTGDNYADKRRARRRKAAGRAFRSGSEKGDGLVQKTSARPYAARVDFGVVTAATWEMIQLLPAGARRQYEALIADSIVFYPRVMAARDGKEYDEMLRRHSAGGLPWQTTLHMDTMELVEKQRIGAEYVTLKYPLGEYARRIGEFRKEAQAKEGKGSGLDQAFKAHANSLYGVLASRHHPVNNFVAANVVTSTARALAWAMSQALNAVQTITDGVAYRRDQIPAITYAECLRLKPDYPINRAEAGDHIPFIDPAAIPLEKAEFTRWYRQHVRRFFGLGKDAGAAYYFDLHTLEHKLTERTKSVVFDGLGVDGGGNYFKATRDGDGEWKVAEFKARSYGKRSKAALADRLLAVYRADRLEELPPVTEDAEILSLNQAVQRAKAALEACATEVYLPLGLEHAKVMAYRIVKASAFVFETPQQRKAVLRQLARFEEKHGCGLELLAMRRGYRDRRQGSVCDVLRAVYEAVRAGKSNLISLLNLNKLAADLAAVAEDRREEIARRKQEAERRLRERIDVESLPPDALTAALVVRAEDLESFKERGQVLMLKPRNDASHLR